MVEASSNGKARSGPPGEPRPLPKSEQDRGAATLVGALTVSCLVVLLIGFGIMIGLLWRGAR